MSRHVPIAWTQLAACTVTTRMRDIGPGGLGFYETVGGPDDAVVCSYATADEERALRAHALFARRLSRLAEGPAA